MATLLTIGQPTCHNGKRKRSKLPALAFSLMGLLAIWRLTLLTAYAQESGSGIISPASGDTISGVVEVMGTAVHPNFLRYELAFRPELGSDTDWVVFAEGEQPVVNAPLAIWDTTVGRDINAPVWPDGRYQLRLRVVRTDYNYDEYYVTGLTISNEGTPTPTPTITPTVTLEGESAVQSTATFYQLTPIPSLTPFPTPTALPTPQNELAGDGAVSDDTSRGLVGQLEQVDPSPLGHAFWQGAKWAVYLFIALLIYLLLRGIGRLIWRWLWQKTNR
ncbi:MAG: hypothetical protein H6662_00105 [Ardenticatenaceae bacterium]|nr:hypothetical protein [Ardenticatenaceae bacterium]MCB8989804.1 hypothetical protein [Ardenticatenaceae bacterium]MCB9003980.1 hypothetical protein [Ardenticatenaceae bacterium]